MSPFALTDLERACLVTTEEVERLAGRVHVTENGLAVVEATSPALAGAAARMKLGGEVEFIGFNTLGLAVYARSRA